MTVTATFRRLSGKHNKLERMAVNIVSETQQAMLSQVLQALDIMRSEPPLKLGSKYVRTHKYSTSWQPVFPHASGGRLEAGIQGNAVDPYGANYTELVGGDSEGRGQLEMHYNTGWPLAKEALNGVAPTGVRLTSFADRMKQAVHKANKES